MYVYSCPECNHKFEKFRTVAQFKRTEDCPVCNALSRQVITSPLVIIPAHMSATGNSTYHSPIDGRLITTAAQRREDLARNDCIEYEPGMRQDVDRNAINKELALDKAVDETFDREIYKMPAHKLERLDAEMNLGVTAEVVRLSK